MTLARFAKFNLVGIFGAMVQLAAMAALTKFLRASAATPIAVEIALLHNLIWHERFTWRGAGRASAIEIARRACKFHASNGLVSLAGNTTLIYVLVERWKTPVLISAAVAIAICSVFNFLLAARWIWRTYRVPFS